MIAELEKAKDILRALVAFDSTSRNSNLDIIAWIESYLHEHNVQTRRVDYVPGLKTNLYAITGPGDRPGILLSGHTDVVPVDGQDWSRDPFTLLEANGKLFGRGVADMKGFIACVLAMVSAFAQAELETPIALTFSCDEEIGCKGVVPLIGQLAHFGPLPRLAIVGEPSRMQVINAHKGNWTFETEVTGGEAHSSTPALGVNAIYCAAHLVSKLEGLAAALQQDRNDAFDPPYSTLHVGVIQGGTVKNIVPGHCKIVWEIRPLPGADLSGTLIAFEQYSVDLEARMKRMHSSTSITTRQTNAVPGLEPEPTGFAENLVMHIAKANCISSVSYTTEAGHFNSAGIPVVICGPGDIAQAHRPDEFIDVSEIENCLSFLSRLCAFCATHQL